MSSVKQTKKAEESLQRSFGPIEFVHATGSAEALARCENTSFDMILCDYYMPNLTGLEILKIIRKRNLLLPFILMIDYQSQGIIVDALRSGAEDVVIVDIAFDEILPIIVEKNFKIFEMKKNLEELSKKLKDSQSEAKDLSLYDQLTHLSNRRFTVKKLEEENDRAKRYNRPLSVLLIDIDHFSEINRVHGKDTGDLVIQKVSSMMKQTLRKVDIIGRYSGDEFLVILPETPMENASVVAEKILENVRSHMFRSKGVEFHVTLSIGISWYPRFGRENYEELLSSAGKTLFQAKNAGYNCVKVAGKFS
ncbi:MAG: diguanylate cyclase [Candidatus Aureabacteria bacterium]|nr:diguanylate cyclase [Candidatus Auribacterota bacterium]